MANRIMICVLDDNDEYLSNTTVNKDGVPCPKVEWLDWQFSSKVEINISELPKDAKKIKIVL